ncbi:MAG: VOC family protein [Ginsengibacter sp.]
MQNVIPMLSYEAGVASLEWLKQAFGFEEDMEMRFMEDGRLTHSQLNTGRNIIMIATPGPNYESINKQRSRDKQMDKWLSVPWIVNGLLVYVTDVDAHFKKAKENGAEILSEIEEGFPGKRYRCADVEGHRWMFMEK